jgi:site-specific DNA-methyltransferase (adenine-specific)
MTLLHLDDCLELLKTMPHDLVDSLITDPPAGISFMGNSWDSDKGGREHWIKWMSEIMRECLRVMKPGAHGLVWALPRTSHWTATALEDAGFEVRDVITHLFGSGFPKSLDISKAIDKAARVERTEYIVDKNFLKKNPGKKKDGIDRKKEYSGSEFKEGIEAAKRFNPATDAAKQWAGWGTALKPASEHWILVRKPCSEKTVAANVLEHWCGGINIDGCRIATGEKVVWKTPEGPARESSVMMYDKPGAGSDSMFKNKGGREGTTLGRFPANLVLSHSHYCTDEQCDIECAILQLDAQAEQNSSRFFYCAKVSPSERGEGNNHPTVKAQKLMRYLCRLITPPQGVVLDPFMGSGSTGLAAKSEGFDFIGIEKDPEYFKIAEARIG